jgi:hypothetical protein
MSFKFRCKAAAQMRSTYNKACPPIQYALPSSSLDRSVVILCVDLSSPASVAPCLDRWTSAIQAHVTSFSGDGRQRLDSLKEGVAVSVRQQRGGGAGGESLPLPEGVLQHSDLLESLLPECNDSPSNWQPSWFACIHSSVVHRYMGFRVGCIVCRSRPLL